MNEYSGLSGALLVRSNIAPARLDVGYAFNAGVLPMKSNIGYALNANGQKDTNPAAEYRAGFASLKGNGRAGFPGG